MVVVEGVNNVPQNMWEAFKTLQSLYKEPLIKMILDKEEHGAYTDMTSITVGIDQMQKTILQNYHNIPDKYKASGAYFTVGHEFAHITTHPGKDSDYWMNGANNFPIESANRQRWLNVLSDIIVNWSVMTGSNIRERNVGSLIEEELLAGFMAGQFNNTCGLFGRDAEYNIKKHAKLLKDGKVADNRYEPSGMSRGQYTNGDPDKNYYEPTNKTPFFEQFVGHGRGFQTYPAISLATKEGMDKRFRQVKIRKSVNGLRKGEKHTVSKTLTFDGRENAEYEPVDKYILENGKEVSARYAIPLCPDCGSEAGSIWDNWWCFKEENYNQMVAEQSGSYIHLMTQLFVYQWAAIYSTFIPYNGKKNKKGGRDFLKDVAPTMDLVMGDD